MKLLLTVAAGDSVVPTPMFTSLAGQGYHPVESSVASGLQKISMARNAASASKIDEVIVELPPVPPNAVYNPMSGLIQALMSWNLAIPPESWGIYDQSSQLWIRMAANLLEHAENTGIDLQVFTTQVTADGQIRVSFKDV